MKTRLLSLIASAFLFAGSQQAMADASYDVIAIYSPGVTADYGSQAGAEARISHLVGVTNDIYADSLLPNGNMNLVHMEEYPMSDTASSSTILSQIQRDSTIQALRNEHSADMVLIYRPYANDGVCGVAYVVGTASGEAYSYAHISSDCSDYVTAHEAGHVLGLGHSHKQNSTGVLGYSTGHGVQNNFVTVMAYSSSFNGAKIYKHSSPLLSCNGLPCGVEIGQPEEADAVEALRITMPIIADFRDPENPEDPEPPTRPRDRRR